LNFNLVSVSAISQNKELLRDDERMPVIYPPRQFFLFLRTGGRPSRKNTRPTG
jgi:hypothetical protein